MSRNALFGLLGVLAIALLVGVLAARFATSDDGVNTHTMPGGVPMTGPMTSGHTMGGGGTMTGMP